MANLPPVPHRHPILGDNGLITQIWGDWFKQLFARVGGHLAPSSFSNSGYQKFPSGIFLQWGITGSVSSEATESVTFPLEFPNACLQAIACARNNSAELSTTTGRLGTGNYSTTGFDIYNRTSVSQTINWFAVGY